MKFSSSFAAFALVAGAMSLPAAALAEAQGTASIPAEGSVVSAPRTLTLTFSDAQQPGSAAASLVMTAMPGVKNHGEMVIRNFTTAWSDENRTMTLTLRQPLRAGTYELRWQAAAADTGRLNGTVNFVVK